jgi:hypothetical protein
MAKQIVPKICCVCGEDVDLYARHIKPGSISRAEAGVRASKGDDVRDRTNPLRTIVSRKERTIIEDRAKLTGMTVSAFLRAAAIGLPVRSVLDLEAIETMATINREQERLADLLRRLDNTVGPNAKQLLTQIEIVQAELVQAAKRVKT